MDWIGVGFWILLAGGQLALAVETRSFTPVLLAMQSSWVSYRLLRRRKPTTEAHVGMRILAWCSALLPMALRATRTTALSVLLFFVGMALVLISLAVLGKAFGIAPADRGLVTQGPYSWLRHPMYAGELLTVLGALISNPTSWNAAVFFVLLAAVIRRIRAEEQLIFGYAGYRQRVRWRLLPLIW